jgi:hypothetical protein
MESQKPKKNKKKNKKKKKEQHDEWFFIPVAYRFPIRFLSILMMILPLEYNNNETIF